MRYFPFLALLLLMVSSAAHASITTNPVTPAPDEAFVVIVRGAWRDGCVPRFESITQSGTTIEIDATADACGVGCTLAVAPYALETTAIKVPGPGLYTVELYVTTCREPRTLVQTEMIAISGSCQFDRSLKATAVENNVVSRAFLQWCDPSVTAAADRGVHVSFYRVLMARGAGGPYVAIGDFQSPSAGVWFTESDAAAALFFFVEAHECNATIAGCTGDVIVRSNVVRVDLQGLRQRPSR